MQIKVAKTYSKHFLSSNKIRNTFLDYFIKDNGHKFIRSSPVVPFCDPSIAFVNAGMNQFKNVFLGKHLPPAPKAANSQKCIRVGGKHNDLDVVGTDGYHHTFFEMLGNWSFGDYFKKEACTMAYNLLTGPYKIDPNRLYVTYFSGDESLGLQPDLECREIWRAIGVPASRIIPFGKGDNFWEMGTSGPCGPCTEIHYDHIGVTERPGLVNTGLADLTELWNIVFIEYNRGDNGNLQELPQKFIDTGMGFERLVALLQNKESNYETDLFMPIFDEIHRNAKGVDRFTDTSSFELQKDYRVVADHTRMVTACVADNLFPDNNHKLRRILRKILLISGKTFGNEKLIHGAVRQVAEILGDTYPEMQNLNVIQKVIDHEIEVYTALRKDVAKSIRYLPFSILDLIEHDLLDYPGFTVACKDVLTARSNWDKVSEHYLLPTEYAFKLYDTYGLKPEAIDRMGQLMNFSWKQKDLIEALSKLKLKSRKFGAVTGRDKILTQETVESIRHTYLVERTDDSFKYNYSYDDKSQSFNCPPVQGRVVAVKPDLEDPTLLHIVTDKTNFYVESGGQESDTGRIVLPDSTSLNIVKVTEENGFIIHSGHLERPGSEKADSEKHGLAVKEGNLFYLHVDTEKRSGNTRHHTATHLLNATVRQLFSAPTCQKSSDVHNRGLKLELSVYGPRLTKDCFVEIESTIRSLIHQGAPVVTKTINSQQLLELNDVTTVPGDIYPDDGIRLVEIQPNVSRELCCGTHCQNVGQLMDFCFTNIKLQGRVSYLFTAVVGELAVKSHQLGEELLKRAMDIKETYSIDGLLSTSTKVKDISTLLSQKEINGVPVPYNKKLKIKAILDSVEVQCRLDSREALRNWVDQEMRKLKTDVSPYIVHCLENSSYPEVIPLEDAMEYFTDRPVMLISMSNNTVGVRCHVPERFQNDKFNAEQWMKIVADLFSSPIEVLKKGDSKTSCWLKERKYDPETVKPKLTEALKKLNTFARTHIGK